MLQQKLKDIRKVKQRYFIIQRNFYGELSKRFPHLMNTDMAEISNKLESELKMMLCASLKYKSIKIRLKASSKWNSSGPITYVNVQRSEPGFYYPQSERGMSDIHYMNLEQYITDKGDMNRQWDLTNYSSDTTDHRDELLVKLTDLKSSEHSGRIYKDKLDFYFMILKEVMAYREKFLCYTDEGYRNDKGAQFKAGRLHIALRDKSMDVNLRKLKMDEDGDIDSSNSNDYDTYEADDSVNDERTYRSNASNFFRYKMSNSDILRMLDYSSPGSKHFSSSVHKRLKLFIEDYDKIKPRLEYEEEKKRKAFDTCNDFLKQLAVYTVPFKVLNELKGK